jgi:hypothetical protein
MTDSFRKDIEIALTAYIKDHHTQEECIGFIAGFEAARSEKINQIIPIMKTLSFEISDEAFALLERINELGGHEYRDTEFNTIEEFRLSKSFIEGSHTEQWFMDRNSNGTYYLIDELFEANLVDCDTDCWHSTYVVTDFGEKVLAKNKKEK